MNLVIVESPVKARTINKYLGDDYIVLASYGHVRDLPSKNGSVDPDNNFQMLWEIDSFSKKYLKEITDTAANSEKIIFATDPDREGEAIAWHIKEVLEQKKLLKSKAIERVVFNEITKKAVVHGIKNPRDIEPYLVNAYMARRALDYLVGFNISPILWTKLPGSKSAGRVQSVALKLISEREHEIELFIPKEYWTLNLNFKDNAGNEIQSKLFTFNDEKIEKFSFLNKEKINTTIEEIKTKSYIISDINKKTVKRNPQAPFTTSTLQQISSGKLGFGASRTMQIAQKLYQGVDIEGDTIGLITYMRTDGTQISNEAISTFRKYITKNFGNNYCPDIPNNYSGKKAKNAQEAHEAIRPTDITRSLLQVKKFLSSDQFKLYELIWNRALSSQMQNAEFDRNTITISSTDNKTQFRATGSVTKFDGFLKLYNYSENTLEKENVLPSVNKGEVKINKIIDEQHFTEPPPRYSEASLVKKLEELGIGRPSTYASIISVLSTRGYVDLINKRFYPTDRGKLITAFLEKLFTKYVDYNFTANLENQLDDISSGKVGWVGVLSEFWKEFNSNVQNVKEKRTREVLDLLNDSLGNLIFEKDTNGQIDRKCPLCKNGILSLKNSFRGGAFIGCANYPECKFTRPLSKSKAKLQNTLADTVLIGKHDNGNDIFLKNGRFGPYIQYEILQDNIDNKIKKKKKSKKKEIKNVKNISIPKGISIESINLKKARYLCSLPKNLGTHPDIEKDITLNIGRFGAYLKCENKSAQIEAAEDIFTIGLNRAITLISDAKPGRISSSMIKNLGEHPGDKKTVRVMKGKFGPYIKYKSLNATIPEEKDPNEITMEEALILIEKRKEYDRNKRKKR